MVGQISVFPDVGGAFFGSYRQARGQRLQEAAMRAEMAAAQADRQRQAQARDAFARLQGPDQVTAPDRIGQAMGIMGTRMRDAGIQFEDVQAPTQRVVREGLTPEQRAREEQRLAQSDPNLFAALGEMQAGPEIDLSDIYDVQASRVGANPENMESAVMNAVNVAASRGVQITPQQAYAEIQGRVGAPEQARPSNRARMADEMGLEGQARVDFIGQTGRYAPRSNAPQINMPASPNDIQIVPPEIVERLGLDPSVPHEFYRDAQNNTRARPIAVPGGGSGGGSGGNTAEEVFANYAARVDGGQMSIEEAAAEATALLMERGDDVTEGRVMAELRAEVAPPLSPEERRAVISAEMARRDRGEVVLRTIDQAINQTNSLSAGFITAFFDDAIPNSPQANLEARTDLLLANLGFDELGRIRSESVTGGGVGSLTERELELLANVRTNVQTSQSPQQLRENLNTFRMDWEEEQASRQARMADFYPEQYQEIYGSRPPPLLRAPDGLAEGRGQYEEQVVAYPGADGPRYRWREGRWRPLP